MRNNVLEGGAFATLRIPIQSLPSMKMEEGDPRCGARPLEPLTQVHHDHHAEDGAVAVAVAEPVAGADVRKKAIKTASFLPPSQITMCGRRKRKRTTTRRRRSPAKRSRYSQVGGVSPGLIVGIGKAGYGITKAIGEHQQKRAKKISDKRWRDYMSGERKSYGGESFNCCLM